jgi:hypothetical protein
VTRPEELDARGRRLRAALAAVLVRDRARELDLVHQWLDTWAGLGLVVAGMTHQEDVQTQGPEQEAVMNASEFRTIFTAILLLLLTLTPLVTGCATAPTGETLAQADYGTEITQADAERLAVAFLETYLKDPGSAQIKWAPVQRGWIKEPLVDGGATRFGYLLDGRVNAKNSYGAYTGAKPFRFLFFNGQLVSAHAQQDVRGTPYMGKIR